MSQCRDAVPVAAAAALVRASAAVAVLLIYLRQVCSLPMRVGSEEAVFTAA